MIGAQLLNDALTALAFVVGLAIILSASIVATAALWQRHERRAGIGAIEQHLAAAAAWQAPGGDEPASPPSGRSDSPTRGGTY